jgi:hypothetical protein
MRLMLETHMFFVRPIFPWAAWEVLVPQISPATFHPPPLVVAHPPAISQAACFILCLQSIACCAGHTEQNLHGFRTTASDWQQCENCELELEHKRVMQLHTYAVRCTCTYAAAGSSLSTSLLRLRFYILSWMALKRCNGKSILPWMQCQGCYAWVKPGMTKDFSEFGRGDTYYCDNCWKWDAYMNYYYYRELYYYHYYFQCLHAVQNCSND